MAKRYKRGSVLLHHTLMCVVDDIVGSHMGFKRYLIRYVDSRETREVAKHELSTIQGLQEEFEDESEFEWELLVPESTCEDSSEMPTPKKRRHADAELDNEPAERLSKNTEHQTCWAVKLFKGKLIFLI